MNNKILGIDIGIKNLSICISNKEFDISYWEVIDLIQEVNEKCEKCKCKASYSCAAREGVVFYSCKRHKNETSVLIKKKKVKSYKIQDIVFKLIQKLNEILQLTQFSEVSKVKIELQPKFNPKMKMISHAVYTKLIEFYDNSIPISFISGKKKFETIFKDTSFKTTNLQWSNTYANRKKIAIEYITFKLRMAKRICELEKLEGSPKKDDLCDAMILCIEKI